MVKFNPFNSLGRNDLLLPHKLADVGDQNMDTSVKIRHTFITPALSAKTKYTLPTQINLTTSFSEEMK